MTHTYQKWVQTTSQTSNPYMGKQMLECGTSSDWSV
jgi:hypothetical protein